MLLSGWLPPHVCSDGKGLPWLLAAGWELYL